MYKNVSGQGVYLYEYIIASSLPKTGDAANITGKVSKDGAAEASFATANPTEIGGGVYFQPLSQAETNADSWEGRWSSTTAGTLIIPVIKDTLPGNNNALLSQLADAVSHGGTLGSSTATLAMAQVNVTSTGGNDALSINAVDAHAISVANNSTTGFHPTVEIEYDGSADGGALRIVTFSGVEAAVVFEGGTGTPALKILGPFSGTTPAVVIDNTAANTGGTGGDGIHIVTDAGHALNLSSNQANDAIVAVGGSAGGNGMYVKGQGGGSGLRCDGNGAAGNGITINAFGTSAYGVNINSNSYHGMVITGQRDAIDLASGIGFNCVQMTPTGTADAVQVNGVQSVDINGRHRLLSGVTKNIQLSNFEFVMTNTAGTPLTGLTVTATRSIDGGAYAACANAVAEIANGRYKITLATTDVNGNVIGLRFTSPSAADLNLTLLTTP